MNKVYLSCKARLSRYYMNLGKCRDAPYYFLLFLYLLTYYNQRIYWRYPFANKSDRLNQIAPYAIVMGISLYLIYSLFHAVVWEEPGLPGKILMAISSLGVSAGFALICILNPDRQQYITGMMLCFLAVGKDYRHILEMFLYVILITLIMGFVGMLGGFAIDAVKPERIYGGHSLGLTYPNIWADVSFIAAILIWYLYLKNKWVMTFLVFWGLSAFNWFIITCQTVAISGFLFPILIILIEFLQNRIITAREEKNKPEGQGLSYDRPKAAKFLTAIIIIFPFLAFTASLILCGHMVWFHDNFYYTRLHSFAMRFVEGGYALCTNAITWIGHKYGSNLSGFRVFKSIPPNIDVSYIVDNAYVAYLITRGSLWMTSCLTWVSLAHWKCLRRKDYRLLFISCYFILFGIMELYGLDLWINFVFLYPMTKIINETAS